MEPFRCRNCFSIIGPEQLNRPGWVACGDCGHRGAYWLFPAYYLASQRGSAAVARAEGQSSCFFHPEKLASVVCDGCGRFLCTVCDVSMGKAHFCTACLQTKDKQSGVSRIENERVLHANLTLTLALLAPILFWPITPFSAPYALYRSIRYFRTPSSLVEQGRWRLYLAMLAASGQVLLMVGGVLYWLARG